MLRRLFFSYIFFLLILHNLLGQDRFVSGVVRNEENDDLIPGVNVLLKNTSIGSISDAGGCFKLKIPEDEGILIFSLVGFEKEEVRVLKQSYFTVYMHSNDRESSKLVTGAYDASKQKTNLGYSTQSLTQEDVNTIKDYNFVNSLSGKVAGMQVRQNALMGGSTNIILRGNNFIHGDNQSLFVIDGIPIDNSTYNDNIQQMGRWGYDYGNAAADISPDDIEKIDILKGPSSTALFGSRGANGAIVITTKKGKTNKGVDVDFSTTYFMGKFDPSAFLKYQNEYGAGTGPYYGSNGYFDEYDVNGDGIDDLVVPTYSDASYGARFAEYSELPIWQWDSFWPESENYGKPYEYKAAADTPSQFFKTSHTSSSSVSIQTGNESHALRFGYSNWISSGIVPNSRLNRHNFTLKTNSRFHRKLSADIFLNYINNSSNGRFKTGCSDNTMSQFRKWWQVNVDVGQLKELYEKSGGMNRTWNIAHGSMISEEADLRPMYWDNPYWTRYKNFSTNDRNRLIGNISLTYDLRDWLSLVGRLSLDQYSELREERKAVGSVPSEFGIALLKVESGYIRKKMNYQEYNFDLFLKAQKQLSTYLVFDGLIGLNIRDDKYESTKQSTNGGLKEAEVYDLSNSVLEPEPPIEIDERKEVYGYFTNLNLDFRNYIYLDIVGRIDVSSALPAGNNAYPYGSIALGWVFSYHLDVDWLTYSKARLSYGIAGNDTRPNLTTDVYIENENFGDALLYTRSSYKANARLQPEQLAGWETGLDLSVFENRVWLDLTYYHTNASNQLIRIPTSSATGYSYKYVNTGNIENKGIELILGGDLFDRKDFTWSMDLNWSKNRNTVKSLHADIDDYWMMGYCGGVSNRAIPGQSYGVFIGTGFEILKGKGVVNGSGYYVSTSNQIIGDPNPCWQGGLLNRLSYKNFDLGFLIDISKGGHVFSYDMQLGQGNGLPDYTAGSNDLGNPIRNTIQEGGGKILEGISENGAKNKIRGRADYYGGIWYWGNSSRNPVELTMYDASYVKFRELYLTYNFPFQWIKSFAQKLSISFVGRNLWIISKKVPYADPESGLGAGNYQGYLSGSYPSVKYFGAKLDISF